MTFRELLHSVNIEDVLPVIEKKIWDHHQHPFPEEAFKYAYNKLLELPYNATEEEILISTYEENEESWIDTSNCEGKPWSDNIDKIVRITDDTILSPEQQVAYCLWSQTFWGFSPEQQENELKFMIEDSEYQMKLGLTYTHQLTDDGDLDFVCGLSSDEEERATKQWEQWRRNRRIELGLPQDKNDSYE